MEGRLAIAPAVFPHSCVLYSCSTFLPFSLFPKKASHCKSSSILSLSRTPLPPRSTIHPISLILSSGCFVGAHIRCVLSAMWTHFLISRLLSFKIHSIPLVFGPTAARVLRHIAISGTCHLDGLLDACANELVRKIYIVNFVHALDTRLSAIHFYSQEQKEKHKICAQLSYPKYNVLISFVRFHYLRAS